MTAGAAPTVLVNRDAAEDAVAAATLALPLAGASRATILAAPLVAAVWARGVAARARHDRALIRTDPVVTADCIGVTAEAAPGNHTALHGLTDWLAQSAELPLEPTEFESVRRSFLSRTKSSDRWSDAVRRALFGDSHRYGVGREDRVAHLTDCGPADLHTAAGELLCTQPVLAFSFPGATPAGGAPRTKRPTKQPTKQPTKRPAERAPLVRRPVRVPLPPEGRAACHLLGTPGVSLGSDDKYALHVAWAMLGGRDGMLDRRLRGERALTYSLAAFSREFADGGYGACFAACAPAAVDEVAEQTEVVLRALERGDFETSLVASAKERLVIGNHRSLQTGRSVTERLCGYAVAGVAPDHITQYADRVAGVTPEQVMDVARRHIGGRHPGGES